MSGARKLTTKMIAVVVIVAILDARGTFASGDGVRYWSRIVVWLVTRRAQIREVESIFEFYIAADAILREEDRRWYAFEIAEVIEHGEKPARDDARSAALQLFALGALYQRIR